MSSGPSPKRMKPNSSTDQQAKDNPFEKPQYRSDLALVVEGKRLHVHKPVLAMSSAYFRDKFENEGDASEMELTGEDIFKYDYVEKFLLLLYPEHSLKVDLDDDTMFQVFLLGRYFECRHVIEQCKRYINRQLRGIREDGIIVDPDRLLCFLSVCHEHKIEDFLDKILKVLAENTMETKDILKSPLFKAFPPQLQVDILQNRCKSLELQRSPDIKKQIDKKKKEEAAVSEMQVALSELEGELSEAEAAQRRFMQTI